MDGVGTDLQMQAEVPKADQRFGYDTKQGEGGKSHAINLQMEQGESSSDSDSSSKQQG
jgi:CspA family cold shock protein